MQTGRKAELKTQAWVMKFRSAPRASFIYGQQFQLQGLSLHGLGLRPSYP